MKVRALVLLGSALSLTACFLPPDILSRMNDVELSGLRVAINFVIGNPRTRAKTVPADRYVAARAKPGGGGTARGRAKLGFRPPFDAELTVGIFDELLLPVSDGARGCMTLESEDFETIFYSVCAAYQADPPGVTFLTGGGVPGAQTVFVPDVFRGELRLHADGTDLLFYGRAVGSDTWTELGSVGFVPAEPVFLGAFALAPAGAEVGFDSPHFTLELPVEATAEETVAFDAGRAAAEAVEAMNALDAEAPDFTEAALCAANAAALLADARAGATALATKKGKSAAKQLAGAEKKLAQAADEIADQDAIGAIKGLGKAGKKLSKALSLLLPTS
jgi:hypothetical protein